MPTNSKFLSNGIDSTVQRKYLAFIGIIFSSPVIKVTLCLIGTDSSLFHHQ
jgi:hypothetical protein